MNKQRYSADREVVEKSDETIDRETAARWQARALACYRQYGKYSLDKWIVRAEKFRDEALEHAAKGGDFGRLVAKIERRLNEARREARQKAGAVRRRTRKRGKTR